VKAPSVRAAIGQSISAGELSVDTMVILRMRMLWRCRANPTPYDPVPSTPTRITGPNPDNQSANDR
jgi:hypothetical protein